MRLINSDGQIVDAKVVAEAGGNANRNEVRLEVGALTLIAALSVMIVSVALSVWAMADAKGVRDLADQRHESLLAQQQRVEKAWEIAKTEDRVQINHMMEMEAKQKSLIEEVEALKHGHR